jgi:thiol-disulfide isomerase/thioredoxin
MKSTAAAALTLLLGLALAGCSSDDTSPTSVAASESSAPGDSSASAAPTPTEATTSAAGDDVAADAPGVFVDRAAYEADPVQFHEAGDVVLFFSAPWCPTCQASVNSLNADGVPKGLAVVQVDFDTATDLRQEYGVTVQHTYVQVDESGQELAKWTGSISGEDIAEQAV